MTAAAAGLSLNKWAQVALNRAADLEDALRRQEELGRGERV